MCYARGLPGGTLAASLICRHPERQCFSFWAPSNLLWLHLPNTDWFFKIRALRKTPPLSFPGSLLFIFLLVFSCLVTSDSLWPHGLQDARLPCPSLSSGVCSNSCPSSQWCHPTISSSVIPSPPALNLSQHQGLYRWVSSSHQVAKGLELQLQHQSFQWIFMADFLS